MRFNIQFKMLVGYLLVVLLVSVGSWWSVEILEQTWADQEEIADFREAEERLEDYSSALHLTSLIQLDKLRMKSLALDPRPAVFSTATPDPEATGVLQGLEVANGDGSDDETYYAETFDKTANDVDEQLHQLLDLLLRLDDSAVMQRVQARDGKRPPSEVLRYILADFIEYRRLFHLELQSPRSEEELEFSEDDWHPLVISIRDRISEDVMVPVTEARKELKNIALQHKRKGKRLATVLPLLPGLIALLLSILITRRVANPIRELRRATERIAGGDFSKPIQVRSRDEVGDLARAMNRMSQRLAELDEMKSGFLFNVSHELKTPLTSIKEAAALLQEEVPGPVNDKQQRLLAIISAETRILIGMIVDLLDLARMEAGRMGYKFERTSPGAIVRRAVDELQFMAQRRGVILTVEEAPQVGNFILDGDKLINAVKNLVGNAIKFSPRGGDVVIRTRLGPPSAEPVGEGEAFWSTSGTDRPDRVRAPSVLISVSDQGPGIPERDLPLIFEKFYQSERRSDSKVKGTGLGLAIVRHVVEAHGGSVAVRSAPASGSTFTISLPLPAGSGLREPADRRPSVAPLEVKPDAV